MEQQLRDEIGRFILESPVNRLPDGSGPFFEEPLVGFAPFTEPLFARYKEVIGPFHLTPVELFSAAFGAAPAAGTVVCWVLPIAREVRRSNRSRTDLPSRYWAETRNFGELLNGALRRHLVSWLTARGQRTLAPQYAPQWQEFADTPVGIASTWSERHAAYAAGLGTFSLNDGLITPRGIAHRLGSVLVDLELPPSPRPYPDHRHNCLYHREGSCGACIGRCPVGALSFAGHDKPRCRGLVYGTAPATVAAEFGVTHTGCGLCQTRVPCEEGIPRGRL
jgi:epoxyqueuosine reductase